MNTSIRVTHSNGADPHSPADEHFLSPRFASIPEAAASGLATPFEFEAFYPEPESHESAPSVLKDVLLALAKMHDAIASAVVEAEQGAIPQSDDALSQVQLEIESLLGRPRIDDGLSSMLVGLHCALVNRGSDFLELTQLRQVRNVIERVRTEPFVTVDSAVDLLLKLEQVGLVVDPPELGALADIAPER